MCLEDLRLGKGRQVEVQIGVLDNGGSNVVVPANSNRVCVSITPSGGGSGGSIRFFSDEALTKPICGFNDGIPNQAVFRIEDFGELVTGSWFSSGSASSAVYNFVSVISQVSAPAIER